MAGLGIALRGLGKALKKGAGKVHKSMGRKVSEKALAGTAIGIASVPVAGMAIQKMKKKKKKKSPLGRNMYGPPGGNKYPK